MGRYSRAFSIKKQFQSPNCQTCQGQSRTLKKIVFLELFLRIIEDEKWNLFEKLGQLRTPTRGSTLLATQLYSGGALPESDYYRLREYKVHQSLSIWLRCPDT